MEKNHKRTNSNPVGTRLHSTNLLGSGRKTHSLIENKNNTLATGLVTPEKFHQFRR